MKPTQKYGEILVEKISLLSRKCEEKSFKDSSKIIFESLKSGGVWHLFGAGHSSMAVLEAFHRAGGLIPINPWLEEYIMPQAGPGRNGPLEKLTGLAQVIFDFYKPKQNEVLTIISNSGINAVPVEMAEIAKSHKVKTIAITNIEHSKATKSRHPHGKKLFEICDLVLDTGGVAGDAAIQIPNLDVPVGPLSTILNSYLVNALAISVCEDYSVAGLKAPVYLSANVEGGVERNSKAEEPYKNRINSLR